MSSSLFQTYMAKMRVTALRCPFNITGLNFANLDQDLQQQLCLKRRRNRLRTTFPLKGKLFGQGICVVVKSRSLC